MNCKSCGRNSWTYEHGYNADEGYWECYVCTCGERVDAADMDAANEDDPSDAAVAIYRRALCMILDAPASMARRIAAAALSGTLSERLEVMRACATLRRN